jgi:hypothetical protein
MKKTNVLNKYATRNILLTACAIALAVAFVVARPQPARADKITVPPVPSNLQVEAGNQVFLVGHAIGTQNYICLPSGSGFAYSLFTPQATLSDDNREQIITHFFSPDPKDGTVRATWEHSRDTSTVWAALATDGSSTDPAFVAPGAIAWLKLQVTNHKDGPTGGDKLSETTFIQRLNTSGGVAPSTGCGMSSDVGKKAFVPYTADYFFYRSDSN